MAGLGFGQMAILHPEMKNRNIPLMETCIEKIMSDNVRGFDYRSWGNDPLALQEDAYGHAAYLGYFNLLLSMNRLLNPESKYAQFNDNITNALVRRLEKSPILLLETYPQERYPVDNCAVIGSNGFSSTGLTIAGSRIFGDKEYFKHFYATVYFGGVPYDKKGARYFVTGGPIGNAMMFAMFTVPPKGTL